MQSPMEPHRQGDSKENNGNSSADCKQAEDIAHSVPALVEVAKLFVVTMLIGNILMRLAEAIYGYVHNHVDGVASVQIQVLMMRMADIRIWQLFFILYFILVMIRHAGAIFVATPLFRPNNIEHTNPNQSRGGGNRLALVDLVLTVLLFIMFLIVSLSIKQHWTESHLLSKEPLFLLIMAFCIGILLHSVWLLGLRLSKENKLGMSSSEYASAFALNFGWLMFSFIEITILYVAMDTLGSSEKYQQALLLFALCVIALLDFWFHGKHWSEVISGRFTNKK